MPDTVKRTCEIEEFTNLHFIHPISGWLVPKFAAMKTCPNMGRPSKTQFCSIRHCPIFED